MMLQTCEIMEKDMPDARVVIFKDNTIVATFNKVGLYVLNQVFNGASNYTYVYVPRGSVRIIWEEVSVRPSKYLLIKELGVLTKRAL